jgi:molybdopterin molybdotransferase
VNDQGRARLLPLEEATERIIRHCRSLVNVETIDLEHGNGRVLATDIMASCDVPPWDNSAMDGVAVCAQDALADKVLSITQRIPAGSAPQPLQPGSAARIFTGAPLPAGADTVVMQENCEFVLPAAAPQADISPRSATPSRVKILQPAQSGDNVRRRGADIRAGSLLFAAGHRLRPVDLGLLASTGVARLSVGRLPRVTLLASGDELVMPGHGLGPGQIYNSNIFVLRSLLSQLGIHAVVVPRLADNLVATRQLIAEVAKESDVILSTGGVSVGEEDHLRAALQSVGKLEIWKLALKPGKPFAFGRIQDCLWFGLPGNPVSAFVTFLLLVRPALLAMMGATACELPQSAVLADFSLPTSAERQEYVRVKLLPGQESRTVTLLADQSSGVLSSVSQADGLAIIPPHTSVVPGTRLRFLAFNDIV